MPILSPPQAIIEEICYAKNIMPNTRIQDARGRKNPIITAVEQEKRDWEARHDTGTPTWFYVSALAAIALGAFAGKK